MAKHTVPVFPLDPTAEWDDVPNAVEASIQYQQAHGGKFGPLFPFAPMTVPDDPDTWEPVLRPQNLLLVSIERSEDARLRQALAELEPLLGRLVEAEPGSPIEFRQNAAIAELYEQMAAAGVIACCARQGSDADDVTFFCIMGQDAIVSLNTMLGKLRRKPSES